MKKLLATIMLLAATALPALAEKPEQAQDVTPAHCNGRVLPEQLSAVPPQPPILVESSAQKQPLEVAEKQSLRIVKLDPVSDSIATTEEDR